MATIRAHLAGHRLHMAVCVVAIVLVVAAVAFGIPALALLAVLGCGVMMVGMLWMMVAMARHK